MRCSRHPIAPALALQDSASRHFVICNLVLQPCSPWPLALLVRIISSEVGLETSAPFHGFAFELRGLQPRFLQNVWRPYEQIQHICIYMNVHIYKNYTRRHPDVCPDPLPPSFHDAHVAKRHERLAGVGESNTHNPLQITVRNVCPWQHAHLQ